MTDSGGPEDPEVARLREQLAAAERAAELRAELEAARAELQETEDQIGAAAREAEEATQAELNAAEAEQLRQEQAEREAEAERLRQEKAEREAAEADAQQEEIVDPAGDDAPLDIDAGSTESQGYWPSLSSSSSAARSDEERAERQRKRANRADKWAAKAKERETRQGESPWGPPLGSSPLTQSNDSVASPTDASPTDASPTEEVNPKGCLLVILGAFALLLIGSYISQAIDGSESGNGTSQSEKIRASMEAGPEMSITCGSTSYKASEDVYEAAVVIEFKNANDWDDLVLSIDWGDGYYSSMSRLSPKDSNYFVGFPNLRFSTEYEERQEYRVIATASDIDGQLSADCKFWMGQSK